MVSPELRLARRALRALASLDRTTDAADYVVTDVVLRVPALPQRSVVFVEHRWMGLPVDGSQRSVVFDGRRKWVTGDRVRIRTCSSFLPGRPAEAAARKAIKAVDRSWSGGAAEVLARSPSQDRFTVVRTGDPRIVVSLHLAVYGSPSARLVWVATFTLPAGESFEVLLDANTLRALKKRRTSQHASACLHVSPDAGGPVPAGTVLRMPFGPGWIDPASARFECRNGQDQELPLPPTDSVGDYCGTAAPTSFDQTILNAFVLANAGLDSVKALGGQTQGPVRLTLLNSSTGNLDKVASARPDLVRPELRFSKLLANHRHAGSDPTILLHELGHLILCGGVGGGLVQSPFETGGESAAVNEGLADFLGLILWSSLRRQHTTQPGDIRSVGAWLFTASQRSYSAYLSPSPPTHPQNGTPHKKGMVLCGALLRFWDDVASSVDAATADAVLLTTVLGSLSALPHQGQLPMFCCASKVLRDAIASTHKPQLTMRLAELNIPAQCPHIQEV